ncbi:MAG: hypothetical protein IPO90_03950 [Flavobacteriales bacterium]|nr:hypothetical protein [Flavobacteriales bacterium]
MCPFLTTTFLLFQKRWISKRALSIVEPTKVKRGFLFPLEDYISTANVVQSEECLMADEVHTGSRVQAVYLQLQHRLRLRRYR